MQNKIKKIKVVVITLVVLMSMFGSMTFAAPGQQTTEGDPRIVVEGINVEELVAGESYELEITLKNMGYYTARDLEYILSIPTSMPLQLTDLQSNKFEEHLYPQNSTTLTYHINVDYKAEEGMYPIQLTGTFYNLDEVRYELDETINLTIIEDTANFGVELKSSQVIETGEDFIAEISLKNLRIVEAKNIVVSLDNLDSNTIINTSSNEVKIDNLKYFEDASVNFNLYASNNLQSGVYPIDVVLTYEDKEGKVKTETAEIFFKVDVENEADEVIIINSVTNSKETVYPDGQFTVTVVVANEGLEVSEDVKVFISQDPAVIPITQSIILINSIEPGENKAITFKMKATDSAKTQNYPLEINVEYDGGIVTQYTGVYISNEDVENSSTPRIIIESFSLGQDKIFVGDEFNLDLTIKNTSLIKNIKNLKIIMSANEEANTATAFLPINQSNSYYIGNLDIEDSYDISIPFKVIANADGKIYSLNVEFEYEDSDGNSYTDSETINIPVYQDTEIAVSDVRIGTQFDSAYTLEVDFYNTGKVDISNMMVDIEGDFVTANSNYYVGDFTTGRMDIYDVEIQGSVPNTIEGTIVFTYDDTFGEQVKYEKEFIVETASGNMSGANGTMGPTAREAMAQAEGMSTDELREAKKNGGIDQSQSNGMGRQVTTEDSNNSLLFLIIGVVILGACMATFIIIKKRRKTY